MIRWRIACALVLVGLAMAPLRATPASIPSELAEASREYRISLVNLLPFREAAVAKARETLATRQQLVEQGLVARREVDMAQQALATAEAALAATRAEMAEAERMVAEAEAAAVLASLPPARPGVLTVTPTLLRFHGPRAWSLPSLERFFSDRFHRALPVSALGQTAVHNRLGFDHRNALDVAVHPDSTEGQALIAWLRAQGVSFLAFRGPVAGESTGAHVHIGEPSPRRAAHAG
jgi:hypothetical protein